MLRLGKTQFVSIQVVSIGSVAEAYIRIFARIDPAKNTE